MNKFICEEPISVLLVDDDAACLRVLRRLLNGEFTVATAESAEEALGMLERCSYNVVITDYNMPGYGGLWLLEMTRKRHPSVRRVLISACPPDNLHLHLKDGLVEFFITKPASLQLILDCMRSFYWREDSIN